MPLEPQAAERCFPPLPRAVAAVGTLKPDGSANFMAVAWHTPLGYEPPRYGVVIGRRKASWEYLEAWPEFTACFLPLSRAGLLQALGDTSGAETDKVARLKLTLRAPEHGKVPLLADAWLAYECRRVERHDHGDQSLFVGEIRGAYRDPGLWRDGALVDGAAALLQVGERRFAAPGPFRGPVDLGPVD